MPDNTPADHAAPGADASPWRNSVYPHYVIQARIRDPIALELDGVSDGRVEMFMRGACDRRGPPVRWLRVDSQVVLSDGRAIRADGLCAGDAVREGGRVIHVYGVERHGDEVAVYVEQPRCAGVGRDAVSWAFLSRKDALHAIYRHYAFPNLSICRFRSESRGDYAADLVFEVDAHADVPVGCPLSFFTPYIAASVEVGRRLYDHCVEHLGVDPRYVTLAVSRMGARVTVDWRAFGPRRLFEILTVIKFIEGQVFGINGLAEVVRRRGIPSVKVDTGPYERSDNPRPSEETGNAFIGPWLRPIGAVHTKSSTASWWYRTTPVPHDSFKVEYVEQLVGISRRKGGPPPLLPEHLQWPEARHPAVDALIESDPRPALPLIALFEEQALLEHLAPEDRATVEKLARSGSRVRSAPGSPAARDLPDADVRRVLDALGADYLDKGVMYEMNCVIPSCKEGGRKARVLKDGAVYWCWRDGCRRGVSLRRVAVELGVGHVLPASTHSSEPVQWVPKSQVPANATATWDRPLVTVVAPECETIEEVRAHRERVYDEWAEDADHRVLIDVSDTGLGKSFAARTLLRRLGRRYRVFGPRDDVKRDYAAELPDAVLVEGRRVGVNCTNDALADVIGRVDPVGETLCSVCPARHGCLYLRQIGLASDSDSILAHGHGPFVAIQALDNGSAIDVVDEDALDAVVETIDLDGGELALFRALVACDLKLGEADDVGLDVEGHALPRRAASDRIELLLSRLEDLLTTDAVVGRDPVAARDGRCADLALARVLYGDPRLRQAVDDLGEADLRAHEGARLDLLLTWQAMLRPMGLALSPADEREWAVSPEREEAIVADEPVQAELAAFVTWSRERVQPVPWPEDLRTSIARPKNIFGDLVEALRHLLGIHLRGQDEPTRLLAFRPRKAGPWVLRLTRRRAFLPDANKVLYLSATTTPTRAELLLGPPMRGQRWTIFAPRLRRSDMRTVIADRSYSKACLRDEKVRARVFETVTKLISDEQRRTGMPVALLGPTEIVAEYLKSVAGDIAETFKLNAGISRSKRAELRALTVMHGFILGWAYGVSGSNEFAVEHDGVRRFLRSGIILGNPVPDLRSFADHHRGLLAGYWRNVEIDDGVGPRIVGEPVLPDWRMTYRAVAFPGHERDNDVLVAANMVGFGDPIATEILDGRYLAEFVQMAGRIRPYIPDPVDTSIEPRVFVFSGVAIPGYEVDRVVGLEELRADLGLPVQRVSNGGRPSRKTPHQALRDTVAERGPAAVITALVKREINDGTDTASITTRVRLRFENAGLGFDGNRVRQTNQAVVKVLKTLGREDEALRIFGAVVKCATNRETHS